MELIPHDEIRPAQNFNFAPMIDFLFLMLSLFATLAIAGASLFDSEVTLAELKPEKGKTPIRTGRDIQQLHISITNDGTYKWLTEFQQYPMENVQAVQEELSRQYQIGALPKDKMKTEVLLHIDRRASWQTVAQLIFGVRELGFSAHPVYEPTEMR